MLQGHEMDLLCSTTHPGPRFSDVTHLVDCAMAIELEHIISEVFGQFGSDAILLTFLPHTPLSASLLFSTMEP